MIMTKIIVNLFERGLAMTLCNNLKELRNAKGINQEDMGSLVGVSRQTISLIERGDYNPSIMVCLRLANVLKVRVEDIFWFEGEKLEGEENE